jgi:hypothetical protein
MRRREIRRRTMRNRARIVTTGDTMRARLALGFVLALGASAATSGPALDLWLEPGSPVASAQPVFARVRSAQCVSLPRSLAPVRIGAEFRLRIWIEDYCVPVGAQDRRYAIPPLVSGTYAIILQTCAGNVPPGVDPCSELERLPLVVTGTTGTASVPAATPGGLVALVLALLVLAAARPRIR